ncbi:hypothetical protein PC9H_000979 [Pleurotus ostreatus]|uniref:Cytidyltransferase-like domain-containing protein n=2 Tax=Pleurotus ostreatus TaxID=5322 RepID=A0A067PAI6_PLEO1|nr:uncharacterized protein PC9H_000979 [Pleurotus ostreatus]KAF7440633.1 hypothetical protein PC9H_000979 [Pleurotus ostreatus]KAJ8699986.1 hypothetical protein PTI98_003058 [Pleurotus ostreatus]KDQ33422.1 hypothetical protein PLEOSDRAFT_1087812 [Pleurotus ostreatus PC15]
MSTPPLYTNSLLFARLPNLSTPHFLSTLISDAAASTKERLLIILFSPLFKNGAISHTESWDAVQCILTFVYVQATKIAQDADRVLMDVDVLLKASDEEIGEDVLAEMEAVYLVQGDLITAHLPPSLGSLPHIYLPRDPFSHPGSPVVSNGTDNATHNHKSYPPTYPVVALGGTFDHLHAGHKILLSMGAWIASEKLIAGVTDDALLGSKSNKDLLQPLPVRISRILQFLRLFNPHIHYDVVPINDVYGPTGWDPNVQGLVVSKETLGGAAAIAKHREAHSLPALQTFVIDVISSSDAKLEHDDIEMLKQTKMSSTFIREWIAAKKRSEGNQ